MFVDANVPMYAAGAEHPYRRPCQLLLSRIGERAFAAVTDAEVHQELLHRYRSGGDPGLAGRVSAIFESIVPDVLSVDLRNIATARRLALKYTRLPARDLIHLAVMLDNGVQSIVTADQHFDGLDEVTRLDPLALARDSGG